MSVMKSTELVNKVKDLVTNHAAVYALGCWGNQLTESLINAKAKQYPGFYTESKKNQLRAMTKLGYVVWGFDCVNMIKSLLWGWHADTSKANGGAIYGSNGVPDTNANGMFQNYCYDKSSDFSNIQPGEFLWMDGHIGVAITNKLAVETTPIWKNGPQITSINCDVPGYNRRNWTMHGKSKFIDYGQTPSGGFLPSRGYYTKGDSDNHILLLDSFLADQVKGNYFGTYTKYCVIAFQKKYGLEQDGNIGPITLAKMKECGLNRNVNLPSRGWFTQGDSGDSIYTIDEFLASQVIGNYFGDYTEACIKALQVKGKEDKIYNDVIDGNFGPKTYKTAQHYGFKY